MSRMKKFVPMMHDIGKFMIFICYISNTLRKKYKWEYLAGYIFLFMYTHSLRSAIFGISMKFPSK